MHQLLDEKGCMGFKGHEVIVTQLQAGLRSLTAWAALVCCNSLCCGERKQLLQMHWPETAGWSAARVLPVIGLCNALLDAVQGFQGRLLYSRKLRFRLATVA